MTFDLFSRFRRPAPARDPRGHLVQRPPPMMARVHAKRPAPVLQVRPAMRRGHHQLAPAAVPRPLIPVRKPVVRAPAPSRRGPVVAVPAHSRKGPVMRAPKRDLAFPPPRSSRHAGSLQAPPFPPPRGMIKSAPRHVHWAPAQAPLPAQPYPYPSHTSSRTTSSRTSSHARTQYSVPAIPRYQPPQAGGAMVHVPHRRR